MLVELYGLSDDFFKEIDGSIKKNCKNVNDEYFSSEKYIRLYNAIDSLNKKMKTTVVLFYFNEMSIKEIAKITGSFEGTVKTRLFAARKRLKKYLETDMEA